MSRLAIQALAEGGAGAATGSAFGPWGAVVGAVVGVTSAILNYEGESAGAATQRRETLIRSSVEPAAWCIGTVRTAGVLAHYSERRFSVGDMISTGAGRQETFRPGVTARMAIILTEGQLSDFGPVFVNGNEMPSASVAGMNGSTIVSDPSGFDVRIAEIDDQLEALGFAQGESDPVGRVTVLSPLVVDLFNRRAELLSERNRIPWREIISDRESSAPVRWAPTVNVYTDLGGDEVSPADVQADAIDLGENWDGTASQLQGKSWALIELHSFEDGRRWGGTLPELQFIIRSGLLGGQYTDNPAAVARWILMERGNVPEPDLIESDEAVARCVEPIVIPDVARGDGMEDKPVHADDVLAMLYPDAVQDDGTLDPAHLPANDVQDRVLAQWNSEFAGDENAEPRYQAHGWITTRMLLDPDTVLGELARAMAGWIIPIGSQYQFIAGDSPAPVATLTQSDIVGDYIAWSVGTSYEQRVNALRGGIAQNRHKGFDGFSVGEVVNAEDVEVDGFRETDVGVIPFQNSELAAKRLLAIELLRSSPELIRGQFVVHAGPDFSYFRLLRAGKRVRLDIADDGIAADFLIEKADGDLDQGVISLIVREDPEDIYADEIVIGPVGLDPDRTITDNTPKRLRVTMTHQWRLITPADDLPGYALDLVIAFEPQVASLLVTVNRGTRPPDGFPQGDYEIEHDLTDAERGAATVTFTVEDDQGDPVLFRADDDAGDLTVVAYGYIGPAQTGESGLPYRIVVAVPSVAGQVGPDEVAIIPESAKVAQEETQTTTEPPVLTTLVRGVYRFAYGSEVRSVHEEVFEVRPTGLEVRQYEDSARTMPRQTTHELETGGGIADGSGSILKSVEENISFIRVKLTPYPEPALAGDAGDQVEFDIALNQAGIPFLDAIGSTRFAALAKAQTDAGAIGQVFVETDSDGVMTLRSAGVVIGGSVPPANVAPGTVWIPD